LVKAAAYSAVTIALHTKTLSSGVRRAAKAIAGIARLWNCHT